MVYLQIIACYMVAVTTRLYVGYAVVGLLVEVNSIFLHLRQLMQICSLPRNRGLYRFNSLINLGECTGLEPKWVLAYACTHLCHRACLKYGGYICYLGRGGWGVGGGSFFEDVPLVEFMYLVFTHMPGESSDSDSLFTKFYNKESVLKAVSIQT